MNKVFTFTNQKDIFKKCLYASIAHAVMVGKYSLLSEEIAWDGKNYLIQNMQGVRAILAFTEDGIVCGIQNEAEFVEGKDNILNSVFSREDSAVIKVAEDEVLPYLLVENCKGSNVPAVSVAFWGDDNGLLSCVTEKALMQKSENILLPYLYKYSDLVKYWKNYYDADEDQMLLIKALYNERLQYEFFHLTDEQEELLNGWFGSNLEDCKQSLREIGIEY